MPELAEVYFYASQWRPGLGQTVTEVKCHPNTRLFREIDPAKLQQLVGQPFEDSLTHGKQMAFRFGSQTWLRIHLGMAGKLMLGPAEWAPHKHDHLLIVLQDRALVFSDYRQFGKVLIDTNPQLPPDWELLPPQPHQKTFDYLHFRTLLEKAPRRSLKGYLLDQSAFPGIGNWMADEILWRSRIHPADTAANISSFRKKSLHENVVGVSRDALRVIGSTWADPPQSWLFPHRWKKGGICPVSGKPLQYETIAGRTTCFSPALQKLKG